LKSGRRERSGHQGERKPREKITAPKAEQNREDQRGEEKQKRITTIHTSRMQGRCRAGAGVGVAPVQGRCRAGAERRCRAVGKRRKNSCRRDRQQRGLQQGALIVSSKIEKHRN